MDQKNPEDIHDNQPETEQRPIRLRAENGRVHLDLAAKQYTLLLYLLGHALASTRKIDPQNFSAALAFSNALFAAESSAEVAAEGEIPFGSRTEPTVSHSRTAVRAGIMSEAVEQVLEHTRWDLLSQQKRTLLTVSEDRENPEDPERKELEGLLEWIDSMQDAAEKDGFPVVFLTEDEKA